MSHAAAQDDTFHFTEFRLCNHFYQSTKYTFILQQKLSKEINDWYQSWIQNRLRTLASFIFCFGSSCLGLQETAVLRDMMSHWRQGVCMYVIIWFGQVETFSRQNTAFWVFGLLMRYLNLNSNLYHSLLTGLHVSFTLDFGCVSVHPHTFDDHVTSLTLFNLFYEISWRPTSKNLHAVSKV